MSKLSDRYQFFSENDFNRANPPCVMSDMNPVFLEMLDMAREKAMVPFIVNSAFRTVAHEKRQGRDGSSSHTKGAAVDLKATNSRTRFRIIQGLLKAGFTRIGVGEGFIHVDMDRDKDPDVMWTYY